MFELQAGGEGGLGDLELLGSRLGGRETVLNLVTRPGESLRHRVVGVTHHPGEDLGGDGERAERRQGTRRSTQVDGGTRGERVADGERGEQRAEEVRAAALEIGRASCRERGRGGVVARAVGSGRTAK